MAALHVRNVPADVHAVLRERAASAGVSLNDYLLSLLTEHASTPTVQEWLDEGAAARPADGAAITGAEIAQIIRESHEERDAAVPSWRQSSMPR